MSFQSINPATGKIIREYEIEDHHLVEKKLNLAHQAFSHWRKVPLQEKCNLMHRLMQKLEEKIPEHSRIITEEMGKPIRESRIELEKCARMIQFYQENAPEFLQDEPIKTQYQKSYVSYQPQGIVLGIMPWNFPFWQVLRFAVPTMLTGNVVIMKHAPNVLGCQMAMQNLFNDSGFPQNVFETLIVEVSGIEQVISSPFVRGVSFTGSEQAGRKVAETAGRHLKKCVLELGGSDAYVVLADANVEHAARACLTSRLINTGQSCVAAKRWIVHKNHVEEFKSIIMELVQEYELKDPADKAAKVGPLARKDLKDKLQEQVERSLTAGAKVLCAMESKEFSGECFYPVTVLDQVQPGQPAFDEELFGPVGSIISADSDEHAIELANLSPYGLGGAIFSENLQTAEKWAREELDTGGVYVNDYYRSMPALPFGGVKASGMGRELSRLAMYEFANVKTIVVNDP